MCEDLTIRNITVKNPWYSQNGDGIDIESCKNTLLYDSNFDVGDDAICIKSGKNADGTKRGKPTENLIIRNCIVYHGHGGVTIGSEMSGGVRNMSLAADVPSWGLTWVYVSRVTAEGEESWRTSGSGIYG